MSLRAWRMASRSWSWESRFSSRTRLTLSWFHSRLDPSAKEDKALAFQAWASYQIREIEGWACAGDAGNVFFCHRLQRKPLVNDPGMHHGTCTTHVPWCMSESLTRGGGENVLGIPGVCATRNFAHVVRVPMLDQQTVMANILGLFHIGSIGGLVHQKKYLNVLINNCMSKNRYNYWYIVLAYKSQYHMSVFIEHCLLLSIILISCTLQTECPMPGGR